MLLKQNKKQKIGYFIAFEGQTVICGLELGGSSCCVCMAQQSYYKLAYTFFKEKNRWIQLLSFNKESFQHTVLQNHA